MKTKAMEVVTYKKQTSKTKYIIEAALEYRPPLNISRNFFSEKKIKNAASIQENTVKISQFKKLYLTFLKLRLTFLLILFFWLMTK